MASNVKRIINLAHSLNRAQKEYKKYGITFQNFWPITGVQNTWLFRFLQRPNLQPLAKGKKIVVYSVFGNPNLRKLLRADVKIFLTGENIIYHPKYANHALNWADLSLGFDYLDNKNYLRFPIWLLMCFPPQASQEDIEAILTNWNQVGLDVATRPGFASLIARHDYNGIRSVIGDLAECIKPVDYPGDFRNNTTTKLAPGWPAKVKHLKGFKFNICPENSDRQGYVTEKLFQAIEAGCIPIYWGSGNNPEPGIINPDRVLFFDPDNPQELSRRITELTTTPTAMENFLRQPPFLSEASSKIYEFYQQLEDNLVRMLS